MSNNVAEIVSQEMEVAHAAEFWVKKDAYRTTNFPMPDEIKGPDNLEEARQLLCSGNSPRTNAEIKQMTTWLELYSEHSFTDTQTKRLFANVITGGLIFISGSFRRQRYLESTNQHDYFVRKIDLINEAGVSVSEYLAHHLTRGKEGHINADAVIALGEIAIRRTRKTLATIFQHAPEDFAEIREGNSDGSEVPEEEPESDEKEYSPSASVEACLKEQNEWSRFTSSAIIHASRTLEIPLLEVPIHQAGRFNKANYPLTTFAAYAVHPTQHVDTR